MQVTQQMLTEKYNSLPADIQQVISSDMVSENLEDLGIKYKLRLDKTAEMIDEVGLVMLGFKKSSDFISSLTKRLGVDRETAESLAIDIDNQVFKKIRESLRGVQFDSEHVDTPTSTATDYGESPTRDSLLQDIERHGNEDGTADTYTSSADYSAEAFVSESSTTNQTVGKTVPSVVSNTIKQTIGSTVPQYNNTTPYEAQIESEELLDPNKTFQDHLQTKIDAASPVVNADPYRESID